MAVQQGVQLLRAGYGSVQGAYAQGQAALTPAVGDEQGLPLAHLHTLAQSAATIAYLKPCTVSTNLVEKCMWQTGREAGG